MSIAGIDVVMVAGLRRCAVLRRRRRNDQAEEDPVCQAEEGVVQAVSGVGAIASVALLLLRCLCRRLRRC